MDRTDLAGCGWSNYSISGAAGPYPATARDNRPEPNRDLWDSTAFQHFSLLSDSLMMARVFPGHKSLPSLTNEGPVSITLEKRHAPPHRD
jgi:hypothetical protein